MQSNIYLDGLVTLHAGDCAQAMAGMDDASVDSCVTDPPYHLTSIVKRFGGANSAEAKDRDGLYRRASAGFMGKRWDGGDVAFRVETWAAVLRLLKPGAHLVAFGGTRTFHRMAVAIEDAGFEIRDTLCWHYGQGFPKSHDPKKAAGNSICRCQAASERDVRSLRLGNVSPALDAADERGKVLHEGVPQSDPQRSVLWPKSEEGTSPGEEPGVEGRRHAEETEGELQGRSLCPSARLGEADGQVGRLHHRASTRDGTDVRPSFVENGGCGSRGPQPSEQRARQPEAISDECGPQAWGSWPVCGGCGKPILPDGLGTALKPATELIILARKPLDGTVAENLRRHGVGALNIDGCRIEGVKPDTTRGAGGQHGAYSPIGAQGRIVDDGRGRWPANVMHDGSDEAVGAFPQSESGGVTHQPKRTHFRGNRADGTHVQRDPDSGSAARFFYSAKADADDRVASKHPTVKPVDLMQWLVRLVTPKGGLVLDPFAGTGTTGEAAWREGMRAVLIEREAEYQADIARRMALATEGPDGRRRGIAKARGGDAEPLPLFGGAA